ncbi:hypothetical protein L226DRAFT_269728 [Lentinus tigrinus ALCF2SS1-7]|uniref:uncharacterized protein n=1 Tax=Lentinus tigrinus ALCF2SS1-7 TaxID=1328758 RepID=UPI001165DB69|nr:hypothetical protein L226DRAFT_269728 [Lentinus tigrinus ALCF2SS1-7]
MRSLYARWTSGHRGLRLFALLLGNVLRLTCAYPVHPELCAALHPLIRPPLPHFLLSIDAKRGYADFLSVSGTTINYRPRIDVNDHSAGTVVVHS